MSHRHRAIFTLACALAVAGCSDPAGPPDPVSAGWRPSLGLPATQDARLPAPTRSQAPGYTKALPDPTEVPTDPPSAALDTGMSYSPADTLTFQSDRRPSEGGYDVYVYDPAQDTVLAIVGVNTKADETNPSVSDDGKWLVFQRGVQHAEGHQQDILLYNRQNRLVSTLSGLNTVGHDETEPSISGDGQLIAYVSYEHGHPAIRLYDVPMGAAFEVPGANRRLLRVGHPALSGDGQRIAYEAASMADPEATDIYLYDIPAATQVTPPFVNTHFRELDPELSADGRRLLFVSDRLGSLDVFEVDLDSGNTDNFALLNSDHDESRPEYLGGDTERLAFNLTTRDEYPLTMIRAFNRRTMQIDTLPVANSLLANSALGR
jgi:Tol biopolymer transport system component